MGLAMRWPVFAAIVPEVVPRTQLPAALALNGVSMNASRIIGPLVAGALIAATKPAGTSRSSPNDAAQFENGSGDVLIRARAPAFVRWAPDAIAPPRIAAVAIHTGSA